MNLSMKWLTGICRYPDGTPEFSEAMTLSGSKVEGFETEGAEIQKVVVAKSCRSSRTPMPTAWSSARWMWGRGSPSRLSPARPT